MKAKNILDKNLTQKNTLEDFDSRTLGCFTSKIAFFKWAWQRVKVLSHPGYHLIPFRLD